MEFELLGDEDEVTIGLRMGMLFALGRTLLDGVLWSNVPANNYLNSKLRQHSRSKYEKCHLDNFKLMDMTRWFDDEMRAAVRTLFEAAEDEKRWQPYLNVLVNIVFAHANVHPALNTGSTGTVQEDHTKWATKCMRFECVPVDFFNYHLFQILSAFV